jgi:hypothetical protein
MTPANAFLGGMQVPEYVQEKFGAVGERTGGLGDGASSMLE